MNVRKGSMLYEGKAKRIFEIQVSDSTLQQPANSDRYLPSCEK